MSYMVYIVFLSKIQNTPNPGPHTLNPKLQKSRTESFRIGMKYMQLHVISLSAPL